MIPLTLEVIADLTGGVVVGTPPVEEGRADGAESVTVTGPVVIDSRLAEPGSLFVAFEGENSDGHDFAAAAVEAGAVAVLGTRPTGHPGVVVDDPLQALGALATHVLGALRSGDLTVVGITGSQGKTSAKDLLAFVLSGSGATVATKDSFNNELGLPLTVLRADASTRYLVLEMGARGLGHIQELTRIAPPDVAVVLNVGNAHVGEFGSIDVTAKAKGELVEALSDDGLAVLNADDANVWAMTSRTSAKVRSFGEYVADVLVSGVRLDDLSRPAFALTADGESAEVRLKLAGEHQALNAAAAAAVATGLGIPLADVAARLSAVDHVSKWRMEIHELPGGVTVINDSYNANPESMRAALKALAAIGRARGPECRTIAVLGEMRELGASAQQEHDAIGRLAVRLDIHQLVTVGEAARAMHLGAYLEGSWGEESVFVESRDEAISWLRDNLRSGDVVLVKASRGARLDEIADALVDGQGAGA